MQDLRWPSEEVRSRWSDLAGFCRELTDEVLALALEPPADAAAFAARAEATKAVAASRRFGDDYSVAYALHYPNGEGGAPTLSRDDAGEDGINVKEHVDPSLVVVEPVADVVGLDVFDRVAQCWLSVEAASKSPGSDFVVFGGSALEKASGGRIRACLHRVVASDYHQRKHGSENGQEKPASRRRFCFIYEQKVAEYY